MKLLPGNSVSGVPFLGDPSGNSDSGPALAAAIETALANPISSTRVPMSIVDVPDGQFSFYNPLSFYLSAGSIVLPSTNMILVIRGRGTGASTPDGYPWDTPLLALVSGSAADSFLKFTGGGTGTTRVVLSGLNITAASPTPAGFGNLVDMDGLSADSVVIDRCALLASSLANVALSVDGATGNAAVQVLHLRDSLLSSVVTDDIKYTEEAGSGYGALFMEGCIGRGGIVLGGLVGAFVREGGEAIRGYLAGEPSQGLGYPSGDLSGLLGMSIRGVAGMNPFGPLSATTTPALPAVPASGTKYKNLLGFDFDVYLTAAAGSSVAVAVQDQSETTSATVLTVAAGTTGLFRLHANEYVTLTYTAAPTWEWVGN